MPRCSRPLSFRTSVRFFLLYSFESSFVRPSLNPFFPLPVFSTSVSKCWPGLPTRSFFSSLLYSELWKLFTIFIKRRIIRTYLRAFFFRSVMKKFEPLHFVFPFFLFFFFCICCVVYLLCLLALARQRRKSVFGGVGSVDRHRRCCYVPKPRSAS